MKRTLVITLALLLLAACGESSNDGTPATTTTAPSTTQQPATTVPPTTTPPTTTAPGEGMILLVRRDGGIMAPDPLYRNLPLYGFYADGRLVYQGPVDAVYPGPLMPNAVQVEVGSAAASAVMAAIVATGLPDITSLFNNDATDHVADGPFTEVTYFDEHGVHVFTVYALEIAEFTDPQVVALADLVKLLDQLSASQPEAEPFPADRLQVVASGEPANTDDPLAVVEPWPLAAAPDAMTATGIGTLRCAVVSTADEPGALAAFREATQLTYYRYEGLAHQVWVRPLLPVETGCSVRS